MNFILMAIAPFSMMLASVIEKLYEIIPHLICAFWASMTGVQIWKFIKLIRTICDFGIIV